MVDLSTALQKQLVALSIGSCTCGVKSPDAQWHDAHCRYRLIEEIRENVEALEQERAEQWRLRRDAEGSRDVAKTARDRAERRVAELQAAGLHTLGDIERAQSSGERAVKTLPYPPIVISADDNGHEHRVGVHEYRTRERPHGGAITISTYVGDHKWIEALLDPKSAKTLAELILSRPSVAALSRPQADDGWRPTHRHVKRGSEYMLLGIGKMQTQGWLQELVLNGHVEARTSVDMREVAIYRGSDGSLWARPIEDFNDGRFEALPSAPATGGGARDA